MSEISETWLDERVALAEANSKLAAEKAKLLKLLEEKDQQVLALESPRLLKFEASIAALEQKNAAAESALTASKSLAAGIKEQRVLDVTACDTEDDFTEAKRAEATLASLAGHKLRLVKDNPGQEQAPWTPVVYDTKRRSYAYVLRAEDNRHFSREMLQQWYEELHPASMGIGNGAWTDAWYRGQMLLRKTAWCTLQEGCTCEYGYSDTWQKRVTSPKMQKLIEDVTIHVEQACGIERGILNSVNLNYYPRGGGVGYHSDDEFLFDGLRRDTCIVSLLLCGGCGSAKQGSREFQVRLKRTFLDEKDGGIAKSVSLSHGDLMTMEGLHQLFYLHSVWPGDSLDHQEDPSIQGERINLTWRTIVCHLDGSKECQGLKCPLASNTGEEPRSSGAHKSCDTFTSNPCFIFTASFVATLALFGAMFAHKKAIYKA